METAQKYFKFIKERPALFAGSHSAYTPASLTEPLINELSLENKEILVLYNIEFVISLVYTYNVNPSQITFYADHKNKEKIAQSLGVKYETELDNIKMKTRPVMLINPPYTNGEQDASEIYTSIIDRCIETFNPVAIGGVTPENLMNGGQKKQKLREKILKKYGLKTLRFLDQKRDWSGKIKVDTVFWVVEEGHVGSTSVTSRHFNQPYTIASQLDEYVDGGTQGIHDWLLNVQTPTKIKLRMAKKTGLAGNEIKISKDYTDSYTIVSGEEWDSTNTKWRVAMGYLRCNTCAVVPPGPSIPAKYRYISFDNETDARKFAQYMLSEPVRFIMKLVYTSRSLDNPQLAYIPVIDLSQFKDITDQVLYQYWNVDVSSQQVIKTIVGDEVPF